MQNTEAVRRAMRSRPERKDAGSSGPAAGEIKSAVEQMNRAFEEFKTQYNRELAEVKAKGSSDVITREQVERINTDLTRLSELKTRLEQLETKANRPMIGANGKEIRAEVAEHKAAWTKFIRKGDDTGLATLEQKAMSVGTAADGGYALPEEIDRNVIELLRSMSPIRSLAGQITVGTEDYKKLVNIHGTSSGWVGETAARTATNTSQLAEVPAVMGEIYANPQATQKSLDDLFFDVEKFIADEIALEFSVQEGTAFVSGDGTSKPKGFLAYATAATADAARAFGTVQYQATGVAGDLRASSATASPVDDLIDMVQSMKAGYRNGAAWLMNSLTEGRIRKVKDLQGNYVWQPSVEVGKPNTILGYAEVSCEAMPDIAANALPIAFANLKFAYLIVDRIGTRSLRDPFTNKPYVGFYTTKRVGGMLVNSNAIKLLKVALS